MNLVFILRNTDPFVLVEINIQINAKRNVRALMKMKFQKF